MDFIKAVSLVLVLEGGISDYPEDRGGLTNYGITERRYPEEDIENMTKERAVYLYKRDFWDSYKIEQNFQPQYRFIIFDMYVNHNPRAVALILQRAVNNKAQKNILVEDGIIGIKTRSALIDYQPELFRILAFRSKYYSDIVRARPSQKKFFSGWMNRIFKISNWFNETGRTPTSNAKT